MKRKHTSTNAARRFLRRRKDQRARAERIRGLQDRRDALKLLIGSGGQGPDDLRRLRANLRTIEQQIRYINHPNKDEIC